MQAGARHLPRAHDGGGMWRHTAPTARGGGARCTLTFSLHTRFQFKIKFNSSTPLISAAKKTGHSRVVHLAPQLSRTAPPLLPLPPLPPACASPPQLPVLPARVELHRTACRAGQRGQSTRGACAACNGNERLKEVAGKRSNIIESFAFGRNFIMFEELE